LELLKTVLFLAAEKSF